MNAKLVGGTIITMDPEHPAATAVAICDGRIAAVGDDHDILAVDAPGAELIDLHGRTVLPGLVDSHVHALDTGLQHLAIDLADAASVADVCDAIARERPRFPSGWVYAMRCATWELREGRYPTIAELDAVCPDQPVFVSSVTGHSAATNSPGLRIIEAGAPKLSRPAPASPEEAGWFPDDISLLAASSVAFGALEREELGALHRSVAERAAVKGVTTLHCLEGQATQDDKDVMVLHEISGALPVRVVLMYQTMDVGLVKAMGLPRIGGCLCVDGACFENTACFYEPYLDKPDTCGSLNYTEEEIGGFVMAAHEAGLQIGMHAIGDRAIDVLTRAYAAAQSASPRPDMRHRVEHFQTPSRESIAIASRLRLALPMQPIFSYLWDRPEADHYVRQFGETRADGMESFARLIAQGLLVSGGSDSPVTDIDPLLGVHSAANNPRASRRTTVEEALRMFTCNGAWVSHDEDEYGTLKPGMSADLVVLGADPYKESATICDIPILMTISRGDVTYSTDDRR